LAGDAEDVVELVEAERSAGLRNPSIPPKGLQKVDHINYSTEQTFSLAEVSELLPASVLRDSRFEV
jgi:hypothetical protein